jgi:hypothetical protein
MGYAVVMAAEPVDPRGVVNALVDEYRTRCLWFLRSDYYPTTHEERLQVLGYIERYGDATAYQRASNLRLWLSQHSSEASAG